MDEHADPDKPQPDHTEDPRKQAQGSGGYDESTQEGSEGSGHRDREDGQSGPPTTESEDDRAKNTGNPNAAG